MKIKEASTVGNRWKYVSFVLGALLFAVSIYAYIYVGKDVSVKVAQERYPLIDISRHLIPREDFLPTIQPLRTRLRELVASESDARISVYIEFLNTGANINLLPEDRFAPASLAKIPIAMAVMGAIEHGVWKLDQIFTLEAEDRVLESSTINTKPVGTKFTVAELLEELLVRSDNTAYQIFIRNIPKSEISAVREAIGLENLFDEAGWVTAKEYSRIIRALYTASYLNRESSEYILELLNKAEFKDFLRAPVPEEIPFPHKFGMGPSNDTYNDSGIVYLPNRPYLITVMVNLRGDEEDAVERDKAAQIMRVISNMAYQFFSTANYETP